MVRPNMIDLSPGIRDREPNAADRNDMTSRTNLESYYKTPLESISRLPVDAP